MAISPIVFNGAINMTQDVTQLRQADESGKASLIQEFSGKQEEQNAEDRIKRVRESDDTENYMKGYDASEKGDNEYAGDGGRNRRRKNKEGQVFIKNKGGFDISV